MQNDAKFGLVVGVGLVIAVAALFFQRSPTTNPADPSTEIVSEMQKNRTTAPAMLPSPASLPKPTTSGATRNDSPGK